MLRYLGVPCDTFNKSLKNINKFSWIILTSSALTGPTPYQKI
ncbi:hypothetical protein J2Z75_002563 [Rhizobium herbae]|uniref:Uncharacterized protein n=1 Tax=Rhizobium herbae TaxID=508661 RepID=A0ABS4EM88_9HYPH|nr:hypothetical protein [Rhizobium herbae]